MTTRPLTPWARRWARETERAVARLGAGAPAAHAALPAAPRRFSDDELAGLPAPVARYFRFALTEGQPLVARAVLEQRGEFAAARGRWSPFTATEHFAVWPPGFVWDARIRLAPLVAVHVRDGYSAGVGVMHAALATLFTLVDQRGTPEMAESALLRYLAEAAWFPTALLPSAGVRWEAIDDASARATIADGATRASMVVEFGPSGEIARVSADRHRDVKGTPVLTPWEGRFGDYGRSGGMRVPARGEVGWILPDGWSPYWRGRTVSARYQFADVVARSAAPLAADALRSTQPPPSAE